MPKVQSKTLFEMPTLECSIKVFHGDNLEILQAMPANSIDSIVTDPPYGLGKEPDAQEMLNDWVTEGHHDVKGKGFMGKEWDAFVPQPIFWRECLRVLKPGGYLLSFAGTRTQDLMALGLRIAGFEIRDMIAWVYGCLSDDSEVLTKYGWERYNKAIHEEILAYDPEADVYQWERPSRWSEYRVESDTAYRIKSDQTDQIVSRGHRCLVERGGVLAFVPADKLSGVERVPYLQGDVSALSQGRGELLLEAVLRQGKKLVEAACGERQRKEVPKQGACWGEKPGMEGRADLFQSQGQVPVSVDQVRSLPRSVHGYVSQGRLRHGASATCGDGTGAVAVAERVRASCQSQCNRQQDREPDAVRVECGPQTVRTRTSYRTTLATVTPIKYTGLIFCPTVSTGAFVARRNGKVFVTGNSGFPKSLDVSKAIDKAAGAERERMPAQVRANPSSAIVQTGFGSPEWAPQVKDPITDAARQWQGWGTALKPAYEPVIVARKPLSTCATNVLQMVESQLRERGVRGEILWKPENASGAARSKKTISSGSIRPSERLATSAKTADESGTPSAEQQNLKSSEQLGINGPHLTLGVSESFQGCMTSVCANPSSLPMEGSAPAAESESEISSPSTTSTAAEHSTASKFTGKSTPSFGETDSRPDTESFAGIATGLTGSMETVHISRDSEGFFLWPKGLPEFVPGSPLTVAANVLAHGTGALNVDGCRIESEKATGWGGAAAFKNTHAASLHGGMIQGEARPAEGRWPANLIHDGSDEVISVFPADGSGSAARFFYSPKVGKEEREFGMDSEKKRADPSDGALRDGCRKSEPRSNVHPTVKPVDLMRYLCRLVTPPGGIVLDPFAGSGTTGIAATIEKFRAILIEREDQYAEICRARVGAAKPMGNSDLWETVASVNGKGR